ncbi:hypothetical protein [Clostridium disporicum]|uniref:hypothetical protein n=1 Tax=Clostridium disporicum TaxID=84024 RepID=UPI00361C86FA
MGSKFYNEMCHANEERKVEDVYIKNIEKHFDNSVVTFPYNCDGYTEHSVMYDENIRVLRLIMEFKYGKDFNVSEDRAVVLVQVLYYLKKFQQGIRSEYSDLPNIILAGDKTTCFIIHVQEVEKYLNYNIDWSIPPSNAAKHNPNLVHEIANECTNINFIVFDIKSNFKFQSVVTEIKRILLNYNSKLKVTERNISEIYDYFIEKVIQNPEQYTAQDLVYFFINVITDNEDTFIHAKKRNILYVRDINNIKVDSWCYNYLISNYSTKYKPSEEDKLYSIKDRLIEDTTRRYNGEFYTPTLWVNEAHKEISKVIGSQWKETCIVWDCAWGTGNLTRDYSFSNLICSTLKEEDLLLCERNNKNSLKFQYDFLNDDIENEDISLPKEVELLFQTGKTIVFFINPPFAEASNGKVNDRKSKEKTADTKMKKIMINDNLRQCSQQLYVQFLYRFLKIKEKYEIKNIYICTFAPILYLTGPRFDSFREVFFKNFKFENGFMFKASNFSDVSSQWEVSFSIWSSGEQIDKRTFNFSIRDINKKGVIEEIDKKQVYNVDKKLRGSNWIKPLREKEKRETIYMKSGIVTEEEVTTVENSALAFFMNDSNNVYANTQGVYILSSPVKRHIKITKITKGNFEECCSLFAARRVIESNWINQKEEYMIPNKDHIKYKEWVSDSIVLSIFDTAAQQSSLRNIYIEGKKYDVINNLFFMSNKEIRELADQYSNADVYEDSKIYEKERYVYEFIKSYNFTKEGQSIIEKARELIVKSFKYRNEFNRLYPEYNVNTWDAGWYQIKAIINKYQEFEEDIKLFNFMLNNLKDKMKPLVYELKFLKQ